MTVAAPQADPLNERPVALRLRIWDSETDEAQAFDSTSGSLSSRMRLSEFFEQWFLPVVLLAEKEAELGTITIYRDALAYWKKLAGDPPIAAISDLLVAEFMTALRIATYRRGRLGKEKPLSEAQVAKHLRTIKTLLYRIGPQTDPKRKAKELLLNVPYINVGNPVFEQRSPFTESNFSAIAQAIPAMTLPAVPPNPRAWWTALIALLFYSGLRIGTVMRLRWEMYRNESGESWLIVPAKIVTKTGKSTNISCHPQLVAALETLCRHVQPKPSDPILPWPHHKRFFNTLHARLQVAAKIPNSARLSPHAWRRTHAQQIAKLGCVQGMEVAQRALDHSSKATTEAYYVELTNKLRVLLPNLWPASWFE